VAHRIGPSSDVTSTKLSAVHDDGAPSGSLVAEKRARKREGRSGRGKRNARARLCPLDKRILRFSGRSREFHSSIFPRFLPPSLPFSLSLSLPHSRCCFAVVAQREGEPGNLANDVLKIPDNVCPLLYDSSCCLAIFRTINFALNGSDIILSTVYSGERGSPETSPRSIR
jgi:hypothetical protein